mgnify:FL=1
MFELAQLVQVVHDPNMNTATEPGCFLIAELIKFNHAVYLDRRASAPVVNPHPLCENLGASPIAGHCKQATGRKWRGTRNVFKADPVLRAYLEAKGVQFHVVDGY